MPTTRTYCQQNHEEYLRILHHNYSQNVQQLGINVSHFAAPFPPSTFYLAPVNWIHTFSAKEKDLETGLSYFGSRYYSSDLSIWLSVDPMSDKYPSLSPYAYCANNPIKLVDPNGEEIGNYYDLNGTYLGTDGEDDQEVYIVTSKEDIDKILSNDITPVSDVGSAMRLPCPDVREQMTNKFIQADKADPLSEIGCFIGLVNGESKDGLRWSQRSNQGDPCQPGIKLNLVLETANNVPENPVLSNFYGEAHMHPSGGDCFFEQPLSAGDRVAYSKRSSYYNYSGNSYLFQMKDRLVTVYNGHNECTISMEFFKNAK